jgi:hypothetical protein
MAKMQDDLRGSAIGDNGSLAEEKPLQFEFYHCKFAYLQKATGDGRYGSIIQTYTARERVDHCC